MISEDHLMGRDGSSMPVSDELLSKLRLSPNQTRKLKLQSPNASNYTKDEGAIMNAVIDASYLKRQKQVFREKEARIEANSKVLSNYTKKDMETSPAKLYSNKADGMNRSNSKGLFDLFDHDSRRQEGSSQFAKQIENANRKARQDKSIEQLVKKK